ncbi:glucose-6-phosphate exchanger SLC37A2 [Trichoplusia ni]|uniref:Sugar phosphate exchanger 3 n=1 Tax=Trichoplusia ni TaxID=7111 RepID=A0A7E5W2H9_TRINI|nr:glucose-6-phosphate exchanger SLC37A2 [Trichoplusia ni]
MKIVADLFTRTFKRKYWRMSGVSRDAPIGLQFIQKLSSYCCPRLQINRLRWHQASVLVLTFFTYMTYHLTRKPISVVKSVLHQNCSALTPPPGTDPSDDQWCNWAPFNTTDANALLGALDSAFLFSYAGAMFVSGMVAERVDLRYFLSFGMLASAIFCYLFGLGRTYGIHNISYYLLVQAGAGIAQTTGWPGTVAIVGKWFGNSKKGLIFGIWNSHTSLGNILGTIMAAEYVDSDWALSFMYPGLVMGVVGGAVWLFLAPEPRQVGLAAAVSDRTSPTRQPSKSDEEDEPDEEDTSSVIVGDQSASLRPNRHSANLPHPEEATERTSLLRGERERERGSAVSLSRALAIPGVLEFSLSLFFAKLVSYTFLYWLPSYIRYTSADLSARQSGELSTVFDVGGAAGAVLAGLVADCSASPALVCVLFYTLCAPMLFIYQAWGGTSYLTNLSLLFLTGLTVNAPYALITTAVSAELGTHASLAGNSRALATVTAIIDGTGSVGAAIGPMLAGLVSSHSWTYVFYMLIGCNFMALFLLLRIARSELAKIRQERRIASPPRVRIE